jgi:hypothetical protein
MSSALHVSGITRPSSGALELCKLIGQNRMKFETNCIKYAFLNNTCIKKFISSCFKEVIYLYKIKDIL